MPPAANLLLNLRALMEDQGYNPKSLSVAAGLGETAVRDILMGRSRRPTYATLDSIARILRVSVDELTGAPQNRVDENTAKMQPSLSIGPVVEVIPAPSRDGSQGDLIPIRSFGRGGPEQEMFLQDGAVGWRRRPHVLADVRNAYGVYYVGSSMEPRYASGFLLWVHPHKPPSRGRAVVVYKTNDAVLVKEFVGWQGSDLVLRQLNPPEEVRIPANLVRECHLVVGSDEEG